MISTNIFNCSWLSRLHPSPKSKILLLKIPDNSSIFFAAVIIRTKSARRHQEFKIDHSFLFMLRDSSNTFFIGRLNNVWSDVASKSFMAKSNKNFEPFPVKVHFDTWIKAFYNIIYNNAIYIVSYCDFLWFLILI